jgi:type 1 glutamine amidotransferase
MELLVLSGGRHPYEESTPVLTRFLIQAGHTITVTEDASVLSDADRMSGYDALVFNTLRAGEMTLSDDEQAGMKSFIKSGKGFICIHISGCVPETWQEYQEITGGGWVMGTSFHPPYGKFTVNVTQPEHAGVKGISDFETNDELYMGIDYQEGNNTFMYGTSEDGTYAWGGQDAVHMPDGTFPLGWTRGYGSGKVFVTLLGHNGLSFETPEFQQMVLNGISWAVSR